MYLLYNNTDYTIPPPPNDFSLKKSGQKSDFMTTKEWQPHCDIEPFLVDLESPPPKKTPRFSSMGHPTLLRFSVHTRGCSYGGEWTG